MSRLPDIIREHFSEEQQQLFERITGGKRSAGRSLESFLSDQGGLRGPFNSFMYNTALGEAAQRLGEVVRFETSLAPELRELAILTVAAGWRAQYEWWAHEKVGRRVGLEPADTEPLRTGQAPEFDSPDKALVHAFCRELMEDKGVSDHLFKQAVELLGRIGVVELVMLTGYYTMISMILNAFEVPLPAGERAPFP